MDTCPAKASADVANIDTFGGNVRAVTCPGLKMMLCLDNVRIYNESMKNILVNTIKLSELFRMLAHLTICISEIEGALYLEQHCNLW